MRFPDDEVPILDDKNSTRVVIEDEDDDAGVSATVKIICIVLVIVVHAVIEAFTAMTLWNWFIAPLGLPRIGMVIALGIELFIAHTSHQISAAHDLLPPSKRLKKALSHIFLRPLSLLIAGFILASFL